MFEAIIMLSLLNVFLLLALRQRNKDNRNLEKTLTRTERQLEAGKETILDLGKTCKVLDHERNYYREAYEGSEKKRQELVDRLHSLQEGGAEDD